jgi:hypothetical protein
MLKELKELSKEVNKEINYLLLKMLKGLRIDI